MKVSEARRKKLKRERRIAVAVVGLLLALVGWVSFSSPDDDVARWTLFFAGTALVTAGVAIVLAFPGYREWADREARAPDLKIAFDMMPTGVEGKGGPFPVEGETEIEADSFYLRVNISNNGDGPLRWAILNIVVLAECQISVWADEAPFKNHYASPLPAQNAEILPERGSVAVAFTAAERDFPPGHNFLYHVMISTPRAGDWPVLATLEGDPRPRAIQRLLVRTSAQAQAE